MIDSVQKGPLSAEAMAADLQEAVSNGLLPEEVALAELWKSLCDDDVEAPCGHLTLEMFGVMPEDLARLDSKFEVPSMVARAPMLRKLRALLEQHATVVLLGACRSGKTLLVSQLTAARSTRARYNRIITLDFFSLRAKSRDVLDRDALWSVLIDDDIQGPRMLAHSDEEEMAPEIFDSFKQYFKSGAANGALLILEHMERLPCNPETTEWLMEVLEVARAQGAHVLMICRGADLRELSHRRVFREIPALTLPDLSCDEVAAWLADPIFDFHREEGLTPKRVIRITGGRPGLVMELGLFLTSKMAGDLLGWQALKEFAEQQSQNFAVECRTLLEVLRAKPEFLVAPLTIDEKELRLRVLATGAVKTAEGGRLVFSSPIISRRYHNLVRPERILGLIANKDVDSVLNKRRYPELAAITLNAVLLAEESPRDQFARFVQVLASWDATQIRIYLRDPGNARLWSLYYGSSLKHADERGAWPLFAHERPEFARAVYTGRRVSSDKGEVYLPLVGTQGHVELVAVFQWEPGLKKATYTSRLSLRALWNTVIALERTMALAIERVAYKRQSKFQRKIYHRSTNASDGIAKGSLQSALREAQCSAVAVLERGKDKWTVATSLNGPDGRAPAGSPDEHARKPHGILDSAEAEVSLIAFLNEGDTARLDKIAEHPKKNGLVLSGHDLLTVFPDLEQVQPAPTNARPTTAIFLRPVQLREAAPWRIVAFIFQGGAALGINGLRQSQLSVVAVEAVLV